MTRETLNAELNRAVYRCNATGRGLEDAYRSFRQSPSADNFCWMSGAMLDYQADKKALHSLKEQLRKLNAAEVEAQAWAKAQEEEVRE